MAKFTQKERAKIMRRMRTVQEKRNGVKLHHSRAWLQRKWQIRISELKRISLSKAGAAARKARKQAQIDAAARAV